MDEKRTKDNVYNKEETTIVIFFLIQHLLMFLGALNYKWESWIPALLICTGAASLVVFVGKYWNYESRAFFCSAMICVSLTIYGTKPEVMDYIIVPLISIVVLMGWYSLEKLMLIPLISLLALVYYHGSFNTRYDYNLWNDLYRILMVLGNTLLAIFMIYSWVKARNENEQKVNDIIDSLKRAEQGKDDFLANVSHEIRTPINTISGMSEVILRENDLDDKLRQEILDIQTSGRQLVSVVSDILDFSELQSGKQEISEVSYNITSTINDIINMANAMRKGKDIEFIVECDTDIPSLLCGDEQRIKRVILNLINNAIKFTNDGCVVLKIDFRREVYGINLSVTVKDTGIGIEKTHIEKLFTSYNQVDTKRNRQGSGIGLGLAISKAIIEKMGGFITVNSELGKGSEFKFVIPQKVLVNDPIIRINDMRNYSILIYVNLEHLKLIQTRDAYHSMVINLAEKLGVNYHICHNIAELKRRINHNFTTHIFISFSEYIRDEKYFDELTKTCKVIVALDEYQDMQISNDKILKLHTPFYALPVANLLNGKGDDKGKELKRFISPESKILVVDDNLINLKVVSGLLKPYRMNIVTAISGAEALEKIEDKSFDLVLMDHMMPEMDGIETLKRIRTKNSLYFREVPIIALTANAVAGAREMFIQEGFQEFVSKPVELSMMDRVLRNFLPQDKIVYDIEEFDKRNTASEIKENVNTDAEEDMDITKADEMKLGDICVNDGITYCGSKEDYIDVLKIHCTNGSKNKSEIQNAYENIDWKNYTIFVHGLKSSMKSIGANKLSEMAKQLEAAGKMSEISYITEHHDEMMKEYDRILKILNDYFNIQGSNPEVQEDVMSLEEISEEAFTDFISRFERAMYEWDSVIMENLLKEIEGKRYKDQSLKQIHETIKKKIDMSDYMSAYETLKTWKEKH